MAFASLLQHHPMNQLHVSNNSSYEMSDAAQLLFGLSVWLAKGMSQLTSQLF